jgi:hypothetical protein
MRTRDSWVIQRERAARVLAMYRNSRFTVDQYTRVRKSRLMRAKTAR